MICCHLKSINLDWIKQSYFPYNYILFLFLKKYYLTKKKCRKIPFHRILYLKWCNWMFFKQWNTEFKFIFLLDIKASDLADGVSFFSNHRSDPNLYNAHQLGTDNLNWSYSDVIHCFARMSCIKVVFFGYPSYGVTVRVLIRKSNGFEFDFKWNV